MSGKRRVISLLVGPVVFALCCYVLPSEIFTSVQSRAAIGTVAWVAIWWVAAPVDYAVTAFLPVVINAFIPMAEMSKVVANYASETIMLLLGASILTVSWEETGLDRRIASSVLRLIGNNLRKQIVFWFVISAALSAVLPNAVVCATVTPIAVSMLKYVGEGDIKNSSIGSKILLVIVYAAGVGGLATPLGGAMNLVTIEYIQQLTGEEYIYTNWIIRYFPVMLVLVASNILFLIRNVKKTDTINGAKEYFSSEYKETARLTFEQKASLALFLIATFLSFTRQLYQHILPGLKPAYIFVTCAILAFLITRKNGERLLLWKNVEGKIIWELIYIFAGGLAVGTLINSSGAAENIGDVVAKSGISGNVGLVFSILLLTICLSDVTSNTATAAVAMPIVISVVQGVGRDPLPYIYVASIGVNLSYMLPTSIRAIPVGYGLQPQYMFKEGWKLTLIVLALMTVVSLGLLI